MMADLIDRQTAIDEVINLWADKPFGNPALVEIKDCIEALPSVQPIAQPKKCEDCGNFNKTMLLIPQPKIIRCGECKHSYETFAGLICSHGICVDCVVRDDFYCAYGERK